MNDFLTFRRMVTPLIIQVLFWVGAGASALFGLITIVTGLSGFGSGYAVLVGLLLLVGGPLVVRIYCELLILAFRMNETLTDIRSSLQQVKGASQSY